MSAGLVPSSPTSPSPDLISMVKGWASRHLEIVLPVCAAVGAAAGAYLVTVFNIAKIGALASNYEVPSEFLSSDPFSNLLWIAIVSLYALSFAFVVLSLSTFCPPPSCGY